MVRNDSVSPVFLFVLVALSLSRGSSALTLRPYLESALCLTASTSETGGQVSLEVCSPFLVQNFIYQDGLLCLSESCENCLGPAQGIDLDDEKDRDNSDSQSLELEVQACDVQTNRLQFLIDNDSIDPVGLVRSVDNLSFSLEVMREEDDGSLSRRVVLRRSTQSSQSSPSQEQQRQEEQLWFNANDASELGNFIAASESIYENCESPIVSYVYNNQNNNGIPFNISLYRQGDSDVAGQSGLEDAYIRTVGDCSSDQFFCSAGWETFSGLAPGSYLAVLEPHRPTLSFGQTAAPVLRTTLSIANSSYNCDAPPSLAPSGEWGDAAEFAEEEEFCTGLTVRDCFVLWQSILVAFGVIVAAVGPIVIYLLAFPEKHSAKFFASCIYEVLSKFVSSGVVVGIFFICDLDFDDTRTRETLASYNMASVILTETLLSVIAFSEYCSREDRRPPLVDLLDAGRFEASSRLVYGIIPTFVTLMGALAVTAFQGLDLLAGGRGEDWLDEDYPYVNPTQRVANLAFLALGGIPFLWGISNVLFNVGFVKTAKNPSDIGLFVYALWKYFKIFAGDIPGIVFGVARQSPLGWCWMLELFIDFLQLHLYLGSD